MTTGTYADAIRAEANSIINFSGGTITTHGGAASGLYAAGGTLNAGRSSNGQGIQINVTGRGSAGIRSAAGIITADSVTINHTGTVGSVDIASAVEADPNSSITLTHSSLNTTQDQVHGALIKGASTLSLGNSSVSTQGGNAHGLQLLYGAKGLLSESDILTSGISSHGIRASSTSEVIVQPNGAGNNSLIHTTGNSSRGIYLLNDAQADIDGITIITDGDHGSTRWGADGIGVQNNAKMTLKNADIHINGNDSNGLDALGADPTGAFNQIDASNTLIVMNGQGGKGAYAYGGNNAINLSNSQVETKGSNNVALAARSEQSSVNANQSLLKITGAQSGGVSASEGGTVNLNNSELQHTGLEGYGINVTSGGTVNATNSLVNVSGQNSNALTMSGGEINLNATQVSALAGNAMSFLSDISTVTASNGSLLKGDAVSAEGATSNIVLDNATWQGNASEITSVDIKKGAQWVTNGSSTVGALDLDNGSVIFDPVSSSGEQNHSSTLTVHGNYNGNNGLIAFNSVLGDDNSATNKLIVEGDTSGSTNVSVNNLGGRGARTYNGIELVHVDGESAGQFSKTGRIVAGAYEYDLARGEENNSKNWYLINAGEYGNGGGDNAGGSGGGIGDGGISPTTPTLRPESGSYAANQAAINNLFMMRLHDRLGETQYIDALTGEKRVTSMWLRTVGGHTRLNDTSGQLKAQENRYLVQLGGDVAQWSRDGLDRYHLGLMAAKGQQWGNTHSRVTGARSDNSVDGYSVGAYGTWYQNDAEKTGTYVDTWAQYSWFDNSVSGEQLATEKYKSSGLSASVEAGYTWKLGQRSERESYFLQPKAQVVWNGVKSKSHTEQNGTQVTFNGDNNVTTRLGVRAFINGHNRIDDGKQRDFEPFIEANWIHNTANYGASLDGVSNNVAGTRDIGEIKVGVEGKINPRLNLWGNVGQQMGGKGYQVIAESGDGAEVIPLVYQHDPDILILDIDIPNINGIDVIDMLRKSGYKLPIIVMSGKNADHYALRSAKIGANGFISKKNNLEDLINAVKTVSSGYGYFPLRMHDTQVIDNQVDDRARIQSLSAREFQVLQFLAEGMEVITIATRMKISNKTVSTYKSRLMDKLGLKTRKDLLDFTRRNQVS
ncbi:MULTISPECIES: autotransporter outer membrane beta-barrel domain-containing protein [unclassified Pantoea]|uniref:autotransporter outer membrane beta-barrel domain-containing protein n=1 Tax=unclassified Pantoea TaxID=2630326 RepID=UPI0024AFAB6E|nr:MULTISPECIES: autotransporter outer membrane beta-barrel domain-containing protein [unclassified Pantoea]MDI6958367.1 autotransporter outer membrane beta-barrel domain-containing protein [Pantoea sp. Pa-EAmG]MDI9222450.1 autotransporter outer membrane beta-barrel domain-containing protein [Pantoea sp. EA-12]